jgi:hypothetical protein
MRTVFSLFLSLVGVVAIVLNAGIFRACILAGFSWTFASLSTWSILLICALLITFVSLRAKERKILQLIVGCTLSLSLLIGNFILHPIYQGDYTKKGKSVSISKNSLLNTILSSQPNFDGLVCIASPTCPFCKAAVESRLNVMHERKPSLNIAVALFTSDTSQMENFKIETSSENLDYFLSPDIKGTIDLCHGAFPTFLFIKNQKIIHIWSNGQMGYPALDWIENKLK